MLVSPSHLGGISEIESGLHWDAAMLASQMRRRATALSQLRVERGTRVTVTLRVTNVGKEPTELAPWGPTVMAPGGVEIIPLPPKKK